MYNQFEQNSIVHALFMVVVGSVVVGIISTDDGHDDNGDDK